MCPRVGSYFSLGLPLNIYVRFLASGMNAAAAIYLGARLYTDLTSRG